MNATNCNKQIGAGLIEVLVAVLILGIGLLGLAGLQTQSLRFNTDSYYRTQATLLANDIMDRMRANKENARTANNYAIKISEPDPSVSKTKCETAACSASDLAKFDIVQWRAQLASVLPSGIGEVVPQAANSAGWRPYTITIEFDASRGETNSDGSVKKTSFSFESRI